MALNDGGKRLVDIYTKKDLRNHLYTYTYN